jgi:hypothetical protein
VKIDLPKGSYLPVFRIVNGGGRDSTLAIEQLGSSGNPPVQPVHAFPVWLWPLAVAGMAAVFYAGYVVRAPRDLSPKSPVRFTITPPDKTTVDDDIALSPALGLCGGQGQRSAKSLDEIFGLFGGARTARNSGRSWAVLVVRQ